MGPLHCYQCYNAGGISLRRHTGLLRDAHADLNSHAGADANAAAALDSDVKSFAYDLVGGAGRDIVEYLSMLEYYLNWNADTMGLGPVDWIIAMRPQLWHEVSAVWPCAYNTTRCATVMTDVNAQVTVDGTDMTAQRDAMRNSMTIPINGRFYKVRTDVGIFEHNNINNANLQPGNYASSIYMIPLTIRGGMPVTYREYVDNRQAQPDVSLLRGMQDLFWTDNGVYSWAIQNDQVVLQAVDEDGTASGLARAASGGAH